MVRITLCLMLVLCFTNHVSVASGQQTNNISAPQNVTLTPRNVHVQMCPDCLPAFRGGPYLYLSMAKWASGACGGSACDRSLVERACSSGRCDVCHCDSDCSRYGDCCADTFLHTPPRVEPTIGCYSTAFIGAAGPGPDSYKMVGRCPSDAGSGTVGFGKNLCENPDPEDLRQNLPVFSNDTGLHYKNAQCARCNGLSEWIDWQIHTFCAEYVDFARVTSQTELLKLLRQEKSCGVHFYWPAKEGLRGCKFPEDPIKTCNVTGRWRQHDADMERACSIYTQPARYGEKLYGNIFCAYCNGESVRRSEHCSSGLVVPGLTPYSLLLDVRSAEPQERLETGAQCTDKEVFDPLQEMCRRFQCPPASYADKHQCVSLLKSAKGFAYILHFELTPRNRDSVKVKSAWSLRSAIRDYITEYTYLLKPRLSAMNFNITIVKVNRDESRVFKLDVQFSVLVGAMIPREEVETRLVALLHRKWWWYEPEAVSPVFFDFSWLPDTSDDKLFTGQDYCEEWRLDVPNGVKYSQVCPFERKEYDVIIPDQFLRNASAYILISELLRCKIIELDNTEYQELGPRTIKLNDTGEVIHEGQFLRGQNGIQICTNFTGQRSSSASNTSESVVFDETEVTLTLVCTSLSLCGLAATLVIYAVLPSRNTLPGKNNILLFSSLFVAQLLFLTGSGARVSTPACRALGVIIHYFWLATFCWKLVCAFHMHRLFTNPLKSLDERKTFLGYVMFCQITPCLVICAVIFVNYGTSSTARIGYAERPNICFLSSNLDVALGFLLPVCLVVVLNVIFFSKTVYALRHRPKIQRHAAKQDMQKTVLYFKMSLILGFTWALGFIALIINERGMWYLFTVVNASIGVFVFIGFGLKNLSLRSLLGRRYGASEQETNSSTNTHTTSAGDDQKNLHPGSSDKEVLATIPSKTVTVRAEVRRPSLRCPKHV